MRLRRSKLRRFERTCDHCGWTGIYLAAEYVTDLKGDEYVERMLWEHRCRRLRDVA